MDLDDVRVDSLVPQGARARGVHAARFLTAFARHDEAMADRVAARRGARRGAALRRHAGARAGASAALQEFPRSHPIASAKGSDNIIAFTTKRYSRTPLVVQGPGAGADVTAMGVFSDILKLLHYLPH